MDENEDCERNKQVDGQALSIAPNRLSNSLLHLKSGVCLKILLFIYSFIYLLISCLIIALFGLVLFLLLLFLFVLFFAFEHNAHNFKSYICC